MPTTDTSSTEESPAAAPARLGLLTFVLATACGLSVANLYYAQPLLSLLASSFHVGQGTAATVVTMTQLGYVIGLITLLPLGDLLENRKLTSRVLVGTGAVLLASAFVGDFAVFLLLAVLVGATSVVAQILIPLAAHLAPDDRRGQVIGRVMSGLLLGILLARTVASLVAAAWGWRSVFVISAALMLATSVVLARTLPNRQPDHTSGYLSLLRSVVSLARSQPALRRRAFCQAMMFGAFTSYWTSIGYELIDDHGLSQVGVGIFALVGAAGAAIAPVAGLLADRGHGQIGTGAAIVLGCASMLLADFGAHQLVLLGLAGVLLDVAVQGHQVFGQRVIYALAPNARARINSVYMSSIFTGGALASAISGRLHDSHGWTGVTLFAAALPVFALAVWGYGLFHTEDEKPDR